MKKFTEFIQDLDELIQSDGTINEKKMFELKAEVEEFAVGDVENRQQFVVRARRVIDKLDALYNLTQLGMHENHINVENKSLRDLINKRRTFTLRLKLRSGYYRVAFINYVKSDFLEALKYVRDYCNTYLYNIATENELFSMLTRMGASYTSGNPVETDGTIEVE